MTSLGEYLWEVGIECGLTGTEDQFTKFFKIIMKNRFEYDEPCVKALLEE